MKKSQKQNPNTESYSYFPSDKNELRNAEKLSFHANDYKFGDLPDEFANLYNLKELEFRFDFQRLPKVICKLTWLKSLEILNDYRHGELIEDFLPDEFVNLQSLECLKLDNCSSLDLKSIYKLTKLKELSIWYRELKNLPNELTNLQMLKKLSIYGNKFDEVPKIITKLTTLENLDMGKCGLKSLPNELANLQKLEYLDTSYNNFTEFPKIVTKLTAIVLLDIGNCGLKSLPDELTNLKELSILYINNNNFNEFPKVIFKLKNLISLEMSGCGLYTLPKEFARLQNIMGLDLCYNKFTKFPQVIFELENLKSLSIDKYLITPEINKKLREMGVDVYLNEILF